MIHGMQTFLWECLFKIPTSEKIRFVADSSLTSLYLVCRCVNANGRKVLCTLLCQFLLSLYPTLPHQGRRQYGGRGVGGGGGEVGGALGTYFIILDTPLPLLVTYTSVI